MKKGSILGVDLNEKSCQISYYDENKEEPETMEAAVDNYQIPLILGYYKDRWVYGQEAKRLKEAGEGDIVTHLFRKAVKRKKVRVGEKIHDGVWLLAKFSSCLCFMKSLPERKKAGTSKIPASFEYYIVCSIYECGYVKDVKGDR